MHLLALTTNSIFTIKSPSQFYYENKNKHNTINISHSSFI